LSILFGGEELRQKSRTQCGEFDDDVSPLIRRFLEALNGTAIAGDGVRSEGGRNYDLPCHVSGDDPAVSASRLPIRPILRTTCLQLVCGIALTSLLVAAPARADSIVFSNLGPGGTYDAGVGYNVSGPTSQAEEATAIGQPFVPLATIRSMRSTSR
jgi:diadenosine tetraphosphatase ApaH/serine/threonine PP2A family protein phosphatase